MSIASTLLLAIFTRTLGSHISTRILHFLSAYQCLPMLTNLHMLFPFVSFCFRLVWSAVLFRIPVSIKTPISLVHFDFFPSSNPALPLVLETLFTSDYSCLSHF